MFLILNLPSPHDWFRIRVNHRLDILDDIFLLTGLVMKGHLERGQRCKYISYIGFWATRDAYMKMWKTKFDKFLDKFQYPLAWRWNSRDVGRFIECVNDQIDRWLIRERKHLFQGFGQNGITGLCLALVMSEIKLREDVTTGIGGSRKLGEKGEE
jgi:hypothetical protein